MWLLCEVGAFEEALEHAMTETGDLELAKKVAGDVRMDEVGTGGHAWWVHVVGSWSLGTLKLGLGIGGWWWVLGGGCGGRYGL